YRLTEIIRAEESGTRRHIPIIAITANALHGEAERCLAMGMDDFVVKPVELHAFRHVLRRWLPLASATTVEFESFAEREVAATESGAGADGETVLDMSILRRV